MKVLSKIQSAIIHLFDGYTHEDLCKHISALDVLKRPLKKQDGFTIPVYEEHNTNNTWFPEPEPSMKSIFTVTATNGSDLPKKRKTSTKKKTLLKKSKHKK